MIAGSDAFTVYLFVNKLKIEFCIAVGLPIQFYPDDMFMYQLAYTSRMLTWLNMDKSNSVTTSSDKTSMCTDSTKLCKASVPF